MACEVQWTASARVDVEAILRHISVVLASPKAASAHLDDFLAAADSISTFPESHAVSSYPALAARQLRPFFARNYVMLYSYDGEIAVVHRVFHTLQDYVRIIAREG